MGAYRRSGGASSNDLRAGLDGIDDTQSPDVRAGVKTLLMPFMALEVSSKSFKSGHRNEGREWNNDALLKMSNGVREVIRNIHMVISDEELISLNILLVVL